MNGSKRLAVLLTLVMLALGSPSASAIPAAKDVARRYADAIVTVERARNAASQGFFVSSSGMVCTVIPGAVENDLVTVTGDDGIGVAAIVVAVDVDGLALLAMQIVPSSPLTALGVSGDGVFSRWLVGLSRGGKGVEAVVGGEEPGGLLLPVPRGAPILNEADDVVAVARKTLGGGRIDAIGVARVRALAQRLRAPPPPPPPPTTTTKKKNHNQHG